MGILHSARIKICIFEPFLTHGKVDVNRNNLLNMSCFWRIEIVCFTSLKNPSKPWKWRKSLKVKKFEVVNSAIRAIFTPRHWSDLNKHLHLYCQCSHVSILWVFHYLGWTLEEELSTFRGYLCIIFMQLKWRLAWLSQSGQLRKPTCFLITPRFSWIRSQKETISANKKWTLFTRALWFKTPISA